MQQEMAEKFNCILEFLSLRDIDQLSVDQLQKFCGKQKVDLILALGSDLPIVAETACKFYKEGFGQNLMFCGGIGHSTKNLKKKVAMILNKKMNQLAETEAEIYADLAKNKYAIETSEILMDKTSTNTSENLKNAITILNDHEIQYQTILLIQDPVLQRRSYVAALDFFETKQVISYAPLIPKLNEQENLINDIPYLWEESRLYELALGEVYRLFDNENGYGPKGKGFLRHVDVPDNVKDSFDKIAKMMPEYLVRCK